jgi:hypothetical protein
VFELELPAGEPAGRLRFEVMEKDAGIKLATFNNGLSLLYRFYYLMQSKSC